MLKRFCHRRRQCPPPRAHENHRLWRQADGPEAPVSAQSRTRARSLITLPYGRRPRSLRRVSGRKRHTSFMLESWCCRQLLIPRTSAGVRSTQRNTTCPPGSGKSRLRPDDVPPDPATNKKFSVPRHFRIASDVASVLIIASETAQAPRRVCEAAIRDSSLQGLSCLIRFSLVRRGWRGVLRHLHDLSRRQ